MANGTDREVTLVLHGLPIDGEKVKADVFARKFKILLNFLHHTDRYLNKKKSFEYLIVELGMGSTTCGVLERPATRKPRQSSAGYVGQAIRAIHRGEKTLAPKRLLKDIAALVKDIGKTFDHGEVAFGHDNIIRIDDFLEQRIAEITSTEDIKVSEPSRYRHFQGVSLGSFDGMLKLLDGRGLLGRAKLILNTHGPEIDRIFNVNDLPNIGYCWNHRVRLDAEAYYTSDHPWPMRLEIKRITPVKEKPDLIRWKGALSRRRRKRTDVPDKVQNLFWDSCVFCAYLYDEHDQHDVASIGQYLNDAKKGSVKIYTSSILLAEVADSKINLKARIILGSGFAQGQWP